MTPLRDLSHGLQAAFGDGRVRLLLSMTAVLIALASVFYHWVEGWDFLDAAYFSVITIATVGYGDLTPQTALGKLFTIFYVLCGLGLFVATATAIADRIVSRGDQARDQGRDQGRDQNRDQSRGGE